MAKNKTLELSIKIAGKIDKSLLSALAGTQNQISGFSKGLSKIGTAGLAAMTALGVGAVKVIADCTEEAANFENYMSDVVKVVDGLADATGKISDQISKETGKSYAENYSDMKKAILDLSTQIPYTQEDLTQLAAAAGQSGKSLQDLTQTSFLQDIAMWGTAMDVTADQAGDWGAKWEQAFNMNHDQVMEIADVINYLGNNYATTAAEIAESVNASASMGQLAGVDVKATAAIAASMQAMGVSSDRVGTSIKRIYTNITKGSSATKTQQAAFEKLGFTAEGIADAMQQVDANGNKQGVQVLQSVFAAINNLPEAEKLSTLNDLFGQWAIEGGAKITQNLSLLEQMLDDVNDASLWSGSMEKEFAIKATTPEALETMRKSTLQALQIELGDAFLPAKKEFDTALIDFMNNVRNNMPALERLAETLGTLASKGVSKLGEKMDEWLPKIQSGVEWVLNNGDKVISIIKGITGVFTAMKLAPAVEGIAKTATALFGNKKATSAMTATAKMVVNAAVVYMNGNKVTDTLNQGNNSEKIGLGGKIGKGLASVGTALGSGATTTTGAAAVGAASIAGGILGVAGLTSAVTDFVQGAKADNTKTAKTEYASGGSKLAMVGGGAAAGAAIGSVVPVVGTAAGALIGAGVGGVGALLGGDALGEAISDSTDEGGWMNNVWQAVRGFFTETLPQFVTETIPDAVHTAGDAISNFFTETVPYAIGYACGKAEVFFTEDVPQFFSNLWDSIVTFFTSTLPTWASDTWNNKIVPFFTEDIPTFFGNLWDSLCTFFTSTLPTWASDTWNNKIVPFFAEDVPKFFGDIWSSVATFFTEALPNIASEIWGGISGWFSDIGSWISQAWASVTNFFGSGYSDAKSGAGYKAHAWGGIMTSPHIGLVAEAGPEAIIPLSRNKNARGISLWMQAGRILGVGARHLASVAGFGGFKAYADGGLAGKLPGISALRAITPQKIVELKDPGDSPGNGGGQGNITYAPQITIQGNADRAVIDQALAEAQAKFEAWYLQMQRRQARTAY